MIDYLPKIEAERIFKLSDNNTDIKILKRLNKVPKILFDLAKRLSQLEFIKYIKITDNEVIASSLENGKIVKVPITKPGHQEAIGIKVAYLFDIKVIDFDEINSPLKGYGSKMVDCVLSEIPNDWQVSVIFDFSFGFWDKMKERYSKVNWMT